MSSGRRTQLACLLIGMWLANACAATRTELPHHHRTVIIKGLTILDVNDPFQWLEDATTPETRTWLEHEARFAREVLDSLPGRDSLLRRFRELYYVDSISAPLHRGGRYFFTRTHADREKAVVYWKEGESGEERVLLDPNLWSADGTASLGTWNPSWDGRKVVYGRKENGEDEATLYVLDVDSGTVSPVDVIPGGKYAGPSWTPDSRAFYYEWLPVDPAVPVADRPGRTEIRLHTLGTDPARDEVIHGRTGDPRTFLSQQLSRDGRYLFVYVTRGWNENDVWMRDLQGNGGFRLLVQGHEATYGVFTWQDFLYVLTDEGAVRSRLFRVPLATPDRPHWKEIVPEDASARLVDATVVGGRLALSYLRDASSEIRMAALDGTGTQKLPLPGIGSTSGVVGNPDEDDAYFTFSSFTTPRQVLRFSAAALQPAIWAQVTLPIDPSRFVVEQVFCKSKDGTKIPLFLIHRRGMAKDGNNPTILYGYGGFDVSLTPDFRASIYPWLEAGGLYVIANLRGGGEYGKAWHDAGRGANKQNVFDDFAAAAQYLAREQWTKPERLGINGGSNGGLLVGAAMTQHPELFGAVVCQVPLLDMLRYHLFGSGKTWIPEYGNPEVPEQFRILHAYSPYHHVQRGVRYPPLLMLSADHDDRVDPMHARKFVAAIQDAEANLPARPLALLRVEEHGGHHGADQVRAAIELSADMYSFLFKELGATPP
jgi:prolyl oligopeptidase